DRARGRGDSATDAGDWAEEVAARDRYFRIYCGGEAGTESGWRVPPAAERSSSRRLSTTAGGRGAPALASLADCLADLVASAMSAAHGLSFSLPSFRSGSTA